MEISGAQRGGFHADKRDNEAEIPLPRKRPPADRRETCAPRRCFARRTRLSIDWPSRAVRLRESAVPSWAYDGPQIRLNLGQRIGHCGPGLDLLNPAGNLRLPSRCNLVLTSIGALPQQGC